MMECPSCKGRGWAPHPAWAEYHDTYPAANPILVKAFFRERGYKTPPDYRQSCIECCGRGAVAAPPVRDPAQLLALAIIGTVGYVVGMAVGYLAWG